MKRRNKGAIKFVKTVWLDQRGLNDSFKLQSSILLFIAQRRGSSSASTVNQITATFITSFYNSPKLLILVISEDLHKRLLQSWQTRLVAHNHHSVHEKLVRTQFELHCLITSYFFDKLSLQLNQLF